MSDSDADELGNLITTTPYVSQTARKSTGSIRPSKPARGTATKGRGGKTTVGHSDVEVIEHEASEEDALQEITLLKGRKPPSRSGRATKGKGKARAASVSSRTGTHPPPEEPIDVDDDIMIDDNEAQAQKAARDMAAAINTAAAKSKSYTTTGSRSYHADAQTKMVQKYEQKLAEAESRLTELSTQLEELITIRQTEAERLLDTKSQSYETCIATQEKTIQELTSQLARVEPLSRDGSILHLLTREAADEEKKLLEKELARCQESLRSKDSIIVQRDKQISQLEQAVKELEFEVRTEKERSTALASQSSRKPPFTKTTAADSKISHLINIYEDMTDCLVTNIKARPSKYLSLDEWEFQCVYSPHDIDSPEGVNGKTVHNGNDQQSGRRAGLNFLLICCSEPKNGETEPITTHDQLHETVHYHPLNLDKEPPEFVQKLDFLSQPFVFERDQLSLFLRMLRERLTDGEQENEVHGDDPDHPLEIS